MSDLTETVGVPEPEVDTSGRGAAPRLGPGADLHRPADGGPRRHDRQHRPAVHRQGPPHVRDEPHLDRHRLLPRLRRPAAAGRPARRPLRPPQGLHDRPERLRRRLAARRSRPERGAAARCPGHPGSRCRARLAGGARPDHHDLPGRPGAQPRLRGVRRHVRRRCGRRPDPRWLADRAERPHVQRPGRLAADVPDQRPDRPDRGPARAALPARVRVAPGSARHPRRPRRHRRPAGAGLRAHPRRQRGVRLEQRRHHRRAGRRRRPARAVLHGGVPGRAPAAAVPDLHEPDARGQLRGDDAAAGRDVLDVLLPEPVHPERHGLQPAQGRLRVPAVQHRHHHQRDDRVGPGRAGSTRATSRVSAP